MSKLFARSHASWTASFEAAEAVFSFPPRSQVLIPGPLHHSLFLYGAVHALCRGLTVLLPSAFRPSRIAPYLRAATHLYAVPFMLGELAKSGCDAPKLGTVFSGGAKLTAEQRQRCEQAWPAADLVEFYGASETSFLTFHSTQMPAADGLGRPAVSRRPDRNSRSCRRGSAARSGGGSLLVQPDVVFALCGRRARERLVQRRRHRVFRHAGMSASDRPREPHHQFQGAENTSRDHRGRSDGAARGAPRRGGRLP